LSYWPTPHRNGRLRARAPPKTPRSPLPDFFVTGVLPAPPAVFLPFQPVGGIFLILRCRIVATLAVAAPQGDDLSHVAPAPRDPPAT